MGKPTTVRLGNRSTNNSDETHSPNRLHARILWPTSTDRCDFRQEIDKLRKEQEELHRNLGICKNFSHLHRDNEDTKCLRAMLEEEDMIDASLIKEKEHQQVLDKEVNHTLGWQLLVFVDVIKTQVHHNFSLYGQQLTLLVFNVGRSQTCRWR